MSTPIHSINHVGLAVRDMHDTAARYERMGFVLTPWSVHSGAAKPGEPVTRMGQGNRCVMFSRNYLEILAHEDPATPSPRIEGYLRRHQGGHIVCFGTEDCAAVDARVAGAGFRTSGVIPLQRDVDTPDGTRTAKFERVQFAPDDSPEGYIQAATHLTPEYVYQPRYIAHPNGCTELSDAVMLVDDVERFAERYRRYTGIEPVRAEGGLRMVFEFSTLTFMDGAALQRWAPGSLRPPGPAIAAVGYRCPDLPAQAQRLMSNGVPFLRIEDRLVVPAEEAAGVSTIFLT
jgi:catechol 2,3-dioxygenase-like lactoylglutathione lyase family enzyme